MISSLQQRLETLYGLERRRAKLGLDTTRELLDGLGNPERRFRSVHVAGTNGKGSVCALVERVLREAGLRTGLFTSPHLVDFRERIRVNGTWADEGWLERTLERIATLPAGRDCTFFEACAVLGFGWFAERNVELAVVEVGLGGRLDCTNVIAPEVTAITSIELDHTEILGDTLEQIAEEKAGIVKPGVPVIVGPMAEGPARVIERIAAERGARLVRVDAAPDPGPSAPFTRLNAGLAGAVLDALAERGFDVPQRARTLGMERARWPGRFERCPTRPELWWDGAHNPAGASALAELCGMQFGVLVLGVSRDKNADAMLAALEPVVPPRRVVATRTRGPRALDPEVIAAAARGRGWEALVVGSVPAACDAAVEMAGGAPVLLTGSLFAVGEAMAVFGGAPLEVQ